MKKGTGGKGKRVTLMFKTLVFSQLMVMRLESHHIRKFLVSSVTRVRSSTSDLYTGIIRVTSSAYFTRRTFGSEVEKVDIEMAKKYGPNKEPWGTPLVTLEKEVK